LVKRPSNNVSPLAPKSHPNLPEIEGARFATAQAGIRYEGRTDVLLALMDKGTQAAGVFTRSKCPSAPVDWCREKLKGGKARALVVNSGNANAFTGRSGREAVKLTAALAAKATGVPQSEIFLASTGVIGEPLDASKFGAVLDGLTAEAKPDTMLEGAKAIMTTDTYPKVATATATLGDVAVSINGMAKGAGMIAPDMGTMLCFLFTDAPIAAAALQPMLARAADTSMNAMTVDGDTSTSDTLMIFATGAARRRGAPLVTNAADARLRPFRAGLNAVLESLAKQVARDGEGARKFVEVNVLNASSPRSAKRIARAIAESPLVKTAIAGEDANWGRVVMAVGKAGEPADRDRLSISFNGVRVAHKGERDSAYDEAEVSARMKRDEIVIDVDLAIGKARARMWTCDLTKAYVEINGDYRS
jgi:glutamate N-acetyltransferase/amino-acid N-acetyltransferase